VVVCNNDINYSRECIMISKKGALIFLVVGMLSLLNLVPISARQSSLGDTAQVRRIRVSGNAMKEKLVHQVAPVYPLEARRENLQGKVVMEIVVASDGSVKQAKILLGHQRLVSAAVEAVRNWRYQPTYLQGQAVEVITRVEVVFRIE